MKKNRKKLLALMLSLGLMLSMAACGDEVGDGESVGGSVPKSENGSSVPEAGSNGSDAAAGNDGAQDGAQGDEAGTSGEIENFLADCTLLKPDDDFTDSPWEFRELINTGWNFAGGIIDGVEMGEEDIKASLELWGGMLNIVFDSDGETVLMLQGNGTLNGSVSLAEDGYLMNLAFQYGESQLNYIGALAVVEDEPVLFLFSDTSAQNVLFFTYISEG